MSASNSISLESLAKTLQPSTASLLRSRLAAELKRRKAQESLLEFTRHTNPVYESAGHHLQIIEKLEAVERGEIDRLMIFMPPRHGKSELASRRFPAWFLGRHPDKQVISASYNSELATDFGRDVRNIVGDTLYSDVFPVSLAPDSKSANRWHTNHGGSYVAAGVGTAITGRGANLGLIDDPFKDREAADSQIVRDAVWKWYTSTFYTRLMPNAVIALIMTRWHDDDLAGRLLNAEQGDRWEILSLPAESDGEALWPEWYPMPALDRIKAAIGPREWSALYQQQPQPDEGTFFKRDWFNWYDADSPPKHLQVYGASDYAVTDAGGDFTEHGIFGVDPDEDIYILDWWFGQTAADEWIESWCDLVLEHSPLLWGGESGVIRKSIEPFLTKRMRERKAYCHVEWLPSVADKPTRARSFQARAAMGKVYLPNNEMGHRLLDMALRFPVGAHDDAVDVLSLFGRMLDKTIPAFVGPKGDDQPRDAWGRLKRGRDSWKTV